MNNLKRTEKAYGFLWKAQQLRGLPPEKPHFDSMEEAIGAPLVKGKIGADIGSGCGRDTYIMAKRNPSVTIVSLDLSDGVYKTRSLTSGLENVKVIKGSVSTLPLKGGIFDFAYSFGVLHHMNDPEKGIRQISMALKKDAPVYLYLYEDHRGNRIKYGALKVIKLMRQVTTRMPPRMLYCISGLMSPFVVIVFSWPARVLRRFSATRTLSDKMPFNFGSGLFSVAGDLYDRFGAPTEHRFSAEEIRHLFFKHGFYNVNVSKIRDTAGWVAWGYKK